MVEKILIKAIAVYQIYISPLLGNHCRFHPTCSHYVQEAISRYGFLKGVLKGLSRIIHCNPFSLGGYDPITK